MIQADTPKPVATVLLSKYFLGVVIDAFIRTLASGTQLAVIAIAAPSTHCRCVAYRLHCEPGTLSTIERIRSGELGEVILFSSTFVQKVDPENHRARNGDEAGPIFDMGPHPINAARCVFESEPTEVVSAVGVRHPEAGL